MRNLLALGIGLLAAYEYLERRGAFPKGRKNQLGCRHEHGMAP